MARITTAKNKLARRAGIDLGLKTNSAKLSRRLNIPPGQHGRKGARKLSDFGYQLREKQKVKWMYGVLEKQFRNYVTRATCNPDETGAELLRLLELRLDNTVFRLNLAPTRAAARQLVSHGHVRVNNRKVDRPSFALKIDDIVSLSPKALKIPAVAEVMEDKNKNVPKWLTREAAVGKITALPQRDDIDLQINENLIIEYYSR